jgi:hypothetical protein
MVQIIFCIKNLIRKLTELATLTGKSRRTNADINEFGDCKKNSMGKKRKLSTSTTREAHDQEGEYVNTTNASIDHKLQYLWKKYFHCVNKIHAAGTVETNLRNNNEISANQIKSTLLSKLADEIRILTKRKESILNSIHEYRIDNVENKSSCVDE